MGNRAVASDWGTQFRLVTRDHGQFMLPKFSQCPKLRIENSQSQLFVRIGRELVFEFFKTENPKASIKSSSPEELLRAYRSVGEKISPPCCTKRRATLRAGATTRRGRLYTGEFTGDSQNEMAAIRSNSALLETLITHSY